MDELEKLIDYGEDGRIDRKKSLRIDTPWHKGEFVKDVMAFANGHEARPAYLLIGIDNQGGLHDVSDTLPDEATLQQIVVAHLDPPVSFSLRSHIVRGVQIAVMEIPTSEERFHIATRDILEPGGRHVLRKGEILIRRGTAKMPLKALDFKLLKQEFAARHSPEAALHVCFAGGSHEVKTVWGWPIPKDVVTQILAHMIVPPQKGFLDCGYQMVPLRFFVHNSGNYQAESVIVEINFPDNCQVVTAPRDERNPRAWPTIVSRNENRIVIEGERLVHGDYRWSQDVYVRFFRSEWCYTLDWIARAGNVIAPAQGTLQVEILANTY